MSDSTTGYSALQTKRRLGWHQANRDEAVALMCDVKPCVIAIGRCENGGTFRVVAPPDDWLSDEEIDAIFSRPARLTDEQVEEMEMERVGEEFCSNPWLY